MALEKIHVDDLQALVVFFELLIEISNNEEHLDVKKI
jgi:hypothetical protein